MRIRTIFGLFVALGHASAWCDMQDAPIGRGIADCDRKGVGTFRCARAVEATQARGSTGQWHRKGEVLTIRHGKGRTLLADGPSESETGVAYSYVGFLSSVAVHVVHMQAHEGDAFMLIHGTSGSQVIASGYPMVSPDAKHLLSYSMDIDAGFNPNNVEIWRVGPQRLSKTFTELLGWGPVEGKWLKADRVAIGKVCRERNTTDKVACGTAELALIGNKWKFVK